MSERTWLFLLVVAYLAGLIHGELRTRARTHKNIGVALQALEDASLIEPRSAHRVQRESGHRIH